MLKMEMNMTKVISKRYERTSCIFTTNKSFDQWGDIFADNVLSSAILDRIVHYSTVIKINGPVIVQKILKQNKLQKEND